MHFLAVTGATRITNPRVVLVRFGMGTTGYACGQDQRGRRHANQQSSSCRSSIYAIPMGHEQEEAMGDQFATDFQYWWEDADTMVHLTLQGMVQLKKAFYDVLAKVPKRERDSFFEQKPYIICNGNYGQVCRLATIAPRKLPKNRLLPMSFIYLRHDIIKKENLLDNIAHEVAHIVRRDHEKIAVEGTSFDGEKGADDLSESWGFKRRYSKTRLRKMRDRRATIEKILADPRAEEALRQVLQPKKTKG
jgi:hypothetical protein